MGVGYQASALHRIAYMVVDENAPYTTEPPPGSPPFPPGARYMKDPLRLRSPAIVDIISWRDKLAIKYVDQLGELLSWDEESEFSESEDAGVSGDVLLRYVAAVTEESGPKGIIDLVGRRKPPRDELHRAFDSADKRGFTGRFPQLLLGPQYWLPFRRNMIIEEPDWQGTINRFGSTYRLEDQVRELRTIIREADPSTSEWTAHREVPDQILGAAWQASETIARICAVATSHRLPFWTTG